MSSLQAITDKTAISLSMLCAIHCLVLPFFIILLPNLTALQLIGDESFHIWMLMVVIPTSLYALTIGCRKHQQYQLMIYGLTGLTLMIVAVMFGENILGEFWEKTLTLVGASIIAFGHYQNFRLCHNHDSCSCPLHGKS